MSEKLEFDLAVRNNDLEKLLEKSAVGAGKLENNLKQAVSILSRKPISAAVQDSIENLTVNAGQFRSEIGAAFGVALKGAQQTEKELEKTKKALQETSKEGSFFSDVLRTAAGVFTGNILTNTLYAIKGAFFDAVKESVNFKRALLEIETILPNNASLTARMVNQLEALSKQYGTSSTSQAKAYYEVISAGVSDTADATLLLTRANELATGGLTETSKTIDLLTTIYNVYGKEIATAEEASDSLFKTVQIGKTTIPELSQSLGEVLPVAKNLGIGLDEVGANLARLTNSGFKTAEAGTLLNALFAAIARNGAVLGPTMNSTAVQTEGLGVVIQRLAEKTNLSSDALFSLLGRQEAVKAILSLSKGGLNEYNNTLDQYTTKTGTAASASKKILENDVGKQWDIFTTGVANSTRSLIDGFVPAVRETLKAINGFQSLREQQENSISLDTKIKVLRNSLTSLGDDFDKGKINASQFGNETTRLTAKMAELFNALPTANNPLFTSLGAVRERAASLNLEIASLKLGIDGVKDIGLIAGGAKAAELVAQLKAANEELLLLSSPEKNKITSAPREQSSIDSERKIQTELAALRLQFATEDKTFQDQLFLAQQDSSTINGEIVTTQIYDQKVREAEAVYQGELLKNQAIKDAREQQAANDLALEKAQETKIKASRAKVITDEANAKKGQLALEQSYQNSRNTLIGQGFTLAATLAKDGSKAQFFIQKAAALAEIAIGDGKARALIPAQTALIPFPANVAAAAQLNAYVTAQTALGAAIVGASSIKGFAGGGIVGATSGADNRVATIRDGEMILNANQQKSLFDMINGGGGSSAPIVIQIDGKTIATAVRDQIQGGFRLA